MLLVLYLLSFVVSIATGIVTVTLLQQAPPTVTQTINRVVQQTIEKVVPDYTPGKTQTIIVKEDDLVVDAISKTRDNIFSLYDGADSKESLADIYSVGNGYFIAKSDGLDQAKSYVVKGNNLVLSVTVLPSTIEGISVLLASSTEKTLNDLPKNNFGKDSDIKAGQTVVAVSASSISKDTVQNILLKQEKDKDGAVVSSWNSVVLGNSLSSSFGGSPVSNLDGLVVGFVSSVANADGTAKTQIIGIDTINKMLSSLQTKKSSTTP